MASADSSRVDADQLDIAPAPKKHAQAAASVSAKNFSIEGIDRASVAHRGDESADMPA